jgi:hypothetical protein
MKRNLLAAACSLLLPLAQAADPVKVIPPQQKTLASPGGRYIFGQVSDFRSDQYMLDTQTGRLWRVVLRPAKGADGSDAGGSFPVLDVVPYVGTDNKISVTPQ